MQAEARFWDRAARKYAASKISNIPAYEAGLARVAGRLKPTDRVLEIGCGTGSTALRLAEHAGSYTGADISGGMIEIAREKLAESGIENLNFTVTPAHETRFEKESFDAVLGFNILHLVDGLDDAIARAHELLAPGGLFITKTPCLGQMGFWMRPLISVMQFIGKAPFVGVFDAPELERRTKAAGFTIEEARAFDKAPNSWFVVARKT